MRPPGGRWNYTYATRLSTHTNPCWTMPNTVRSIRWKSIGAGVKRTYLTGWDTTGINHTDGSAAPAGVFQEMVGEKRIDSTGYRQRAVEFGGGVARLALVIIFEAPDAVTEGNGV